MPRVLTARAESARLYQQAEAGGPQRRRWRAEADRVDGFIADALHVLEDWFIAATEPLLATFEERHPGDEWFGVILADIATLNTRSSPPAPGR